MDYGCDIASHTIDSNGRRIPPKLDSRGQIPTVSGVDNVMQSLRNRLLTYIGTYSHIDPDYGSQLKDYLGLDNNSINQAIICLELETQCLKDPRVETAKAEYENGNYHLKCMLVGGEEIELEGIL
jgi:phage baseplate assembly protein W